MSVRFSISITVMPVMAAGGVAGLIRRNEIAQIMQQPIRMGSLPRVARFRPWTVIMAMVMLAFAVLVPVPANAHVGHHGAAVNATASEARPTLARSPEISIIKADCAKQEVCLLAGSACCSASVCAAAAAIAHVGSIVLPTSAAAAGIAQDDPVRGIGSAPTDPPPRLLSA